MTDILPKPAGYEEKLKCANDIKDGIEVVLTPEYPQFLQAFFNPFVNILRVVPTQTSEGIEQRLRNTILDIIQRLPFSPPDTFRTYVPELYDVCLNVVKEDNADNGVPAIKVLLELHKNFRQLLELQAGPLLEFIIKVGPTAGGGSGGGRRPAGTSMHAMCGRACDSRCASTALLLQLPVAVSTPCHGPLITCNAMLFVQRRLCSGSCLRCQQSSAGHTQLARWFSIIKKSKWLVRAGLEPAPQRAACFRMLRQRTQRGHDMGLGPAWMSAQHKPLSRCPGMVTAVQTFTELPATVAELLAPAAVPGADPPWAKHPGVAIPSYKGFKVAAECPMLGERARCSAPEWCWALQTAHARGPAWGCRLPTSAISAWLGFLKGGWRVLSAGCGREGGVPAAYLLFTMGMCAAALVRCSYVAAQRVPQPRGPAQAGHHGAARPGARAAGAQRQRPARGAQHAADAAVQRLPPRAGGRAPHRAWM